MKQQELKINTIKALLIVFVLTGLCTFGCKAHSFKVYQTNEFEPSNMFGVVFPKPIYIKGSKLGINYNRYFKDFDYTYSINKAHSYGINLSHHFNGKSDNRHNSQSIEIPMIYLKIQTNHKASYKTLVHRALKFEYANRGLQYKKLIPTI